MRKQGFTLLEMMIAVVILGVLAAIATPTFVQYIYKARVTEAITFLGEIKQRQEAYRSEFDIYCAVDGASWGTYNPSTIPGGDPVIWSPTTNWEQLAASPDGPIRFQYAAIAAPAGTAAPGDTNLDDTEAWFAARARGDLDDDGDDFTLEIYSQSNHVWNSHSGQKGYE